MNCHLEPPKSWGPSNHKARGNAPWNGFPGCGIPGKLQRQHKRDTSPTPTGPRGAAAGTPQQLWGWSRQQEEQGREHCQRAREDNRWERTKRELDWKDNAPLSTVNSAGTHKPGVPLKASLTKSGHIQNMKETITACLPTNQAVESQGCISRRRWKPVSQQMGFLVVTKHV